MNGLTNKEVLENRTKYGTNNIITKKQNSFLKLFVESLGDPIIKILIIALLVKIIFLFKDFNFFETIGILISILLSAVVSSVSEYGSESALKKLEEDSAKIKVKVKRNNKVELINIEEVVVNDVVILSTGDKVPADGEVIKGFLKVDESMITGESVSKEKRNKDIVYRGSIVVEDEGIIKIKKVGQKTLYGSIASELQEKKETSPLKERLTILAKNISKFGYIGAILVSLSFLFSKLVISNNFYFPRIIQDLSDTKLMFSYILQSLTMAVTVIVVSVPEGLPLMITLVLSSNMKRMLKSNVLVRKLVGIETAGNLNYLLTDKTGTITKGKLVVNKIIDSKLREYNKFKDIKNEKYQKEIYYSIFYNSSSYYDTAGNIIGGNTTDKSLLKYIPQNLDFNPQIIKYIPFSSKSKYSLVILKDQEETTYIKGAPEILLNKCTKYLDEEGNVKNLLNKLELMKKLEELTSSGLRVIALVSSKNYHITSTLNNLIFIGLVIIKDELREESKESIEIIKKAGIKPIMITGDDINTSITIAKECGIINSKKDLVLTSNEFNSMTDEEIIKKHKDIAVIARALPKDKSRLVKILKSLDYVVGMTGDGVNDAPALKKADVGFSMGSGTEVAKEASDIVILDDNIKSIVSSILFGRTTFKSIRKFITFQLSMNICAVTISIIGPFIGYYTPITIVQMLWINMIMDTFAGIAFSYEPPLNEYLEEKPKNKKEPIIDKYMKNEIFISGIYQALICILFIKLPFIKNIIRYDIADKYLLTAYFSLFVFLGIFNSLNARTKRINIVSNLNKNKPFVIILSLIILCQLIIIYKGGSIFRTYGLNISELILVLIISLSIIPVDWLRKLYWKKQH